MTIQRPNRRPVTQYKAAERAQIERLAHLLDNAIPLPLINYRIGWEPILGLIPGIGDIIGVLLSSVVIIQAARIGTPKTVLLYMILNAGIESLIGLVPVAGDLFDFVWKANTRNVNLMRQALDDPHGARRHSRKMIGILFSGFFGVLLLLVFGVSALGWVTWQWFLGVMAMLG